MKKWALCMCMVLVGTIGWSNSSKAANDTTTVQVEATYYQTDARRMGQMINDFRTSTTDAWYWNKDGTKTVYNSGSNTKLGTLTYDYDLEAIAMQRAVEIALNWDHTRPNGQLCFNATVNSARSNGENIAIGYSSVEAVFTGWQENEDTYAGQGHRRNMLQKEFNAVGVGYAVVNGVKCWVQEFAQQTYNTAQATDRDGKKSVSVEVLNSNLSSVKAVPSQSIVSALVGGNVELPTVDTTIMLTDTWSHVGDIPVTTSYEWNIEDTDVAKIENGRIMGVSEGTTQLTTTVLGKKVAVTVNILSQEEKEHTYDSGVITKEPDCIGKGVKTYTCTGCGDTYTEEIPALGHDWPDEDEYTVITPATCTSQGEGRRYCKRGCRYYFKVVIPAGHTYDSGVVIKKPSCTEKGTKQYTCTGCGVSYTEEIPANGHTKVIDPAVPATTTTTGLTEGSHCSVCNTIIEQQQVIPVLEDSKNQETEGEGGKKDDTDSGDSQKDPNDYVTVKVDAAYNQTEARTMFSMINEFRTSKTDAWYWDWDDTTKVVCNTDEDFMIGTLEYDYDLEAIAMQRAAEIAFNWNKDHIRPNGEGCTTVSVNGAHANGENIAMGTKSASGAFYLWKETNEKYAGQGHRRNMLNAAFQSVGIGYAEVNGVGCWVQEFSRETYNTDGKVNRDGAQQVDVEVKKSFVKQLNLTPERTAMSVLIGDETALPTLDIQLQLKNTWEGVGFIPVQVEYEWKTENSNIARIEDGKLIGVKEGVTKLTTTIIDKPVSVTVNVLKEEEKEHKYDTGEILQQPLCGSKGKIRYTCTICGYTYEDTLPELGHDWEETIIKQPTCSEYGTVHRVCRREGCGADYTENAIRPTGNHTIVIDPAVPATVTSTGLTEGSHCSVCGKIFKYREVVPKLTAPSGAHSGNDQTSQNQTSTTESEATTNSSQYSDVEDIDAEDWDEDWEEEDAQEGDYEEYDSLAEVETVRKTQITKTNAVKKGFTVRWKGIVRACNGYEVSYSTKKNMKGAKNVRIAPDKKSFKAKRLKAKKKYYVRIRAYRIVKVNGTYKRVYSAWSKIKTVRTK